MNSTIENEQKYIIQTYKRQPVVFVKGEGKYLFDTEGKRYLDMVAGLGVNNIGHCHPSVVSAVKDQVEKLIHTSNLYYTEPQVKLAKKLIDISFKGKVFFANSGAEANECAVKLARKHAKSNGKPKPEIITALRSFHGRTLKMLAATGQPDKQKPFEPLPPGFVHVPLNDYSALTEAITQETAAIMLEPVQGEGGVYPCDKEYLDKVRQLCDEEGLLLIFDEVQTGFGRTGEMFAFQVYEIEPDIMTVSKSLAGGLPIAATIAKNEVAKAFDYGDHGTTFGGGPVVSRAALAAIEVLETGSLPEKSKGLGEYLIKALDNIDSSCIDEIRGIGLMVGIAINKPVAGQVVAKCLDEGIIINNIGDKILRLLPPLIIDKEDIDITVEAIERNLKSRQ
jgi:acetylornithine/N-succinyldiaminopimelate aminotransferase